MKIFNEKEIQDFLNKSDYDVRKSGNARWIDQKCTPDVCSVIADCILNYCNGDFNKIFTRKGIQFFDYSISLVKNVFKKVGSDEEEAASEYDKFFHQPMKLFANAGILFETKNGRQNSFRIVNKELLEYISLAEKYALTFLYLYISKVLADSSLTTVFNKFFQSQTKNDFDKLKDTFERFTIANTPINKETECRRIFTKVINPLAYINNSLGTEDGRLSKNKITYDMLMYNRDNFRDIYSEKPKDMTRKEYESKVKFKPNENYYKYLSNKAKQFIRVYNQQFRNGSTELLEADEMNVIATQMHHIFPESEFPIIAYYLENIIALTPNQHLVRVHPKNKTATIDVFYQYQCLLAKADRIKENIEAPNIETIYEFTKFLYVIRIGLDDESYLQVENYDYNGLKTKLTASYR